MKHIAHHPSGASLEFDEEHHVYTVRETGAHLQSATTFIGRFFPKFDTEKMASRCVGKPKYRGMTVEEIKAAWAAEADRGRSEGTNVHFYAECLLNGEPGALPAPQSEREERLFFQAAAAVLQLEERFVFVESEMIVFSPVLWQLAGTIDLVMYDPQTNELILLDWKQNKKIDRTNPYDDADIPISHLEACDYNKYALQLNLYEFLLRSEKYPGFGHIPKVAGYRKALIHLTEENHYPIGIGDFQKEIAAMVDDIPF